MIKSDTFHNRQELIAALYRARLVLKKKHATKPELAQAAFALNKAVVTLQRWLAAANMKLGGIRAGKVANLKKRAREKYVGSGPLTTLSFNGPDGGRGLQPQTSGLTARGPSPSTGGTGVPTRFS